MTLVNDGDVTQLKRDAGKAIGEGRQYLSFNIIVLCVTNVDVFSK